TVLIVIAASAALFAAVAVAFLLFFDPNDFREDVESAVREATGRDLSIAGDVDLKIVPWLAVSVSDVTLSNAPGFGDEAFARLDSAELSVKFWPLILRQTVIVGTAGIDGLVVRLEVDEDNVGNWEDLAATSDRTADDEAAGGRPAAGRFAVAGVAVRNATISYAAGGSAYSLGEADVEIGRVTAAAGTLSVDGVSLEGIVSGVAEVPSSLSFETAGIVLDTAANVATMQPVEISVLGIDVDADIEPFSYAGEVRPKAAIRVDAFSPRSVMTLFGVEPPETADPAALGSMAIGANAQVGAEAIRLTDIDFRVDDTTFTGSLALPLGETNGFRFDLSGDAIDLNRYMAPATGDVVEARGETAPVEIPA
ncbi:MAG: AsmA family protein, partial [Proteobacteria bacterium]|nr:AsmA family protein [Pseudomonadota bacterium]